MMRMIAGAACLLVLGALGQEPVLPPPDAMAVQPDASDYISRTNGTLMAQGNPRRYAGIGVPWLGLLPSIKGAPPRAPTTYETHDIFVAISALNSSVARAASLGVTAGCDACLVPAQGRINPDTLHHLDMVLRQARDAGIKLIIPLAGGGSCPGGQAQDPSAAAPCVFAGFRHRNEAAFYTDPDVRADFAATVTALLTHLNPLTGIAVKDDPTIMAWENCDGCGQGIDAAILADWTEFVGRTIKAIDTHHLYENGAFAGRLGKQPGHVLAAQVALPSVDMVGDRAMPGMDAGGGGLDDAADQVSHAGRVFMIDAYGWTPAQFTSPEDLQAFLRVVIKNRVIAAAFIASVSGHADAGGYLPAGDAASPDGAPLFFPGAATPSADLAAMTARARAVRRFSFGMNDMLTLPFANVGKPQIISAQHGRITFRGAAGATTYSIARSPDITVGGSWDTICDKCVTDAQASWQDPSPPSKPTWYRMLPFNANDHSGMYSDPVRGN